jgi:hypothetical protein
VIKAKSGKPRTVDLKTALIRDDSDEQKYILLLMHERKAPSLEEKKEK